MDVDIDGRIINIKMYERNITQDCELDLNMISEFLPEVNSKYLSNCDVVQSVRAYKRSCVKCCLHLYPEDRASGLFRNAVNHLPDYTPLHHIRPQNLLSNGQGKLHATI